MSYEDAGVLEYLSLVYGEEAHFAMLVAFLDESGSHAGEHLCVVAGYVGAKENWTRFAAEWRETLHPRKHLHLTALRWNQHPQRIMKMLDALGPLPDKHGLTRVMGGMWHKDYNSIVKGKGEIQETIAKPWLLAAQIGIIQTLRFIPQDEEVAFIFEEQTADRQSAQILHDTVFRISKKDERVKGISFLKKSAYPGLDVADFLAFVFREYLMDKHSRKAQMGLSILGNGDAVGYVWEPDKIKALVETI